MFWTIDRLIQGDNTIIGMYLKAVDKWDEIMRQPDSDNVESLQKSVAVKQFWFENNCDTPELGREIMAITALVRYYSPSRGFGANVYKARLVYDAIKKSKCADDIKSCVDNVAKVFGLFEQ